MRSLSVPSLIFFYSVCEVLITGIGGGRRRRHFKTKRIELVFIYCLAFGHIRLPHYNIHSLIHLVYINSTIQQKSFS